MKENLELINVFNKVVDEHIKQHKIIRLRFACYKILIKEII